MKQTRFSLRAIVITAAVTACVTLGVLALVLRLLLGPGGFAILQSLTLINTRFVASFDADAVADATLDTLVDGLGDRWSAYFTPGEYRSVNASRQNVRIGVGVIYTVSPSYDAMVLEEIEPNSPAERAGLQAGERIVAVEGTPFTRENFDDLVGTIAGQEGDVITFTVEAADGTRREVAVTLGQVQTVSVSTTMLEGDVGYVRLKNFYRHSAQDTIEAVDRLMEEGARALVFDVRANPGGYVEQLTELLDYLLPEGPIFAERSSWGLYRTVRSDASCVDVPMAVLVDADSYSAAELFAAQLRESVGATVVGEQTSGKGYYQQLFPLANGGALNLSTGAYTTGGGTSLIGVGLAPDVLEHDTDAQLEKALDVLAQKVG